MACVVEITTWLRGNSKDDKSATVLQKKKVRIEGNPDHQPTITRFVKLAANICGVNTKNKFEDGVYYLLTAKSKATYVSYRFVEGDEAVRDEGFYAHEWRDGIRGYRGNK